MPSAKRKNSEFSDSEKPSIHIPMLPPQRPHSTPKEKRGYRRAENKRRVRQPELEPEIGNRGFSLPSSYDDGD